MNWFVEVLKKYAVFSGRARRKEYWMYTLFVVIISIVLAIIDGAMGSQVLSLLFTVAILLPSLGVGVRRLHDTGRTGWWLLIGLIPLIGSIVLLVFMCTDGQPGENKYGPNPKEIPAAV